MQTACQGDYSSGCGPTDHITIDCDARQGTSAPLLFERWTCVSNLQQARCHAQTDHLFGKRRVGDLRASAVHSLLSANFIDAAALKIIKSQLSRGAFDWAVTDGNAEKAHLALMQLNDKEFNKAVRAMATSKNGWLLERYLDQLDSDKLVQAFVARLGRSASTSTAWPTGWSTTWPRAYALVELS